MLKELLEIKCVKRWLLWVIYVVADFFWEGGGREVYRFLLSMHCLPNWALNLLMKILHSSFTFQITLSCCPKAILSGMSSLLQRCMMSPENFRSSVLKASAVECRLILLINALINTQSTSQSILADTIMNSRSTFS